MTATNRVWLTRDAYQRLEQELAALRGDTASGSDAVTEQYLEAGHRQARIRELQELLHNAVIEEAPPDDGVAEPGMVVTVRFDDDDAEDTATFLLGVPAGVDTAGLEVCSPASPLGTALIGATQGEQRTYTVPSGATVRVTLLSAVPYGRAQQS